MFQDSTRFSARLLVIGLFLAFACPSEAAVAYSGRAFGAQVHTTLPAPATVTLADTGLLPAAGGSLSASLVTASAGSFQSGAETCQTQGSGSAAASTATVVNVSAFVGMPAALSASEVSVRSDASCGAASGSTTITGLTFGGLAVTVTGAANQTVSVAGVGTLVINEQVQVGTSDITVNGLHLTLGTGDEVIVGSAHSDVTCTVPTRPQTWGSLKGRYN